MKSPWWLGVACSSLTFLSGASAAPGDEGQIRIGPAGKAPTAVANDRPEGFVRVAISANSPIQERPVPVKHLPEGMVLFRFEDADLQSEVLPLFREQTGLELPCRDIPAKRVTVKLNAPVRWEHALALVCRFADVHLTVDSQGRAIIKDGWSGELGSGEDFSDVLDRASPEAVLALRERQLRLEAARAQVAKRRAAIWKPSKGQPGVTTAGGFSWSGGTYSQGTYSQGTYSRGTQVRAQVTRGEYSRGQYSRGVNSQGQYTRGARNTGQYSQGNFSRGFIPQGNRTPGQTSQGTYPQGNRN